MESTGSKPNQDWQHYFDIPSREQLRIDLATFLSKRPEFNGSIKIGKTYLRDEENFSNDVVVSSRYEIDDRYEMVKARNIFAECETEELALKFERALQAIAKEADLLIPGSDFCEGSFSGNAKHRFVIYVTKLKENLFKCVVCSKVATLDDMQVHHLEHDGVRTALATNKILKKLGRKQLPGHLIEPREWTVESLISPVCSYCGRQLKNRHALHEHEREHCPNNPNRRDKAVCEVCGMLIGARDMDRHMLTHGDSHMVNCDICGTRMRADNMPRHLRTHEKATCEVCGKILSVRHLPTHMKLHTEGPAQKQCPVCSKMISKSFFNKHMRTQHSDEATKKPCPVCGRMLAENSYNKHIRTQHPTYKKPGVAKGRVEKASTSKASSSSSKK